jgi:flagellar motor switch protein FliN/FliY
MEPTTRDLGPMESLPIEIEGVLDERNVTMRELIALRPGSLLRLHRSAGEYVDVLAGGAVLAFGEVVVVENVMGIRLTVFYSER